MKKLLRNENIALIIPCLNEEASIANVIKEFANEIPGLQIYVFDNKSTDKTAEVARLNGANVISVSLKGKGNVVRRMFADVNADIYVMVDGDQTYDPKSLGSMIKHLVDNNLDMVVGRRITSYSDGNAPYRPGHKIGNYLLSKVVMSIFGAGFTDMLSGYRIFTRRFVKSFPAISQGFEIETELTVHSLQMKIPFGEFDTSYYARGEGSESKLSTIKDGFRILKMIAKLIISELPLQSFSVLAALLLCIALTLVYPVINVYINTGVVPRFPTAILSISMVILSMISFITGLILNNIVIVRIETKRIAYLSITSDNYFFENS